MNSLPFTCGACLCSIQKLCGGGNEIQYCHVISVRIFYCGTIAGKVQSFSEEITNYFALGIHRRQSQLVSRVFWSHCSKLVSALLEILGCGVVHVTSSSCSLFLMCFFSLLLLPVCFLSDLCRWVLASSSQGVKDEAQLYSVPLNLLVLAGSWWRICSASSCDTEQTKSLFSLMVPDLCISTYVQLYFRANLESPSCQFVYWYKLFCFYLAGSKVPISFCHGAVHVDST